MKQCVCKTIVILIIILFVLLGVPLLLNFSLLAESPLKEVVGGAEAPIHWLIFWGSYLAGLGSLSVAAIARYDGMKNRKREQLTYNLNERKSYYYLVEGEFNKLIDIHSLLRLADIVRAYTANPLDAVYKQKLWFNDLTHAIQNAEKYKDFHPKTNTHYLSTLQRINEFCFIQCEKCKEILVSVDKMDTDSSVQQNLFKLAFDMSTDTQYNELSRNLRNEGLNYLHELREDIKREYTLLEKNS